MTIDHSKANAIAMKISVEGLYYIVTYLSMILRQVIGYQLNQLRLNIYTFGYVGTKWKRQKHRIVQHREICLPYHHQPMVTMTSMATSI